MDTRKRSALIAGSSGLVGSYCLRRLLEDARYQRVYSLVRSPSGISHPKLDEQRVDFEQLEDAPIPAADDVYCCLGTTIARAGSQAAFERVDHDYVLALGRATRSAGTQRFLLISALGADPVSRVFYNRVKGRTEIDLQQLDFPALHIFRPSLLTGPRTEFRLGERLAAPLLRALGPLMRGNLARYRAVHADHVARCLVEAAFLQMQGVQIHYPSATVGAGAAAA